nr:MAG TPA: co-chaperone HscB [Bacteriophage sp.]
MSYCWKCNKIYVISRYSLTLNFIIIKAYENKH